VTRRDEIRFDTEWLDDEVMENPGTLVPEAERDGLAGTHCQRRIRHSLSVDMEGHVTADDGYLARLALAARKGAGEQARREN